MWTRRLLIVDSDAEAREALARMLKERGFAVDCCGRAVEAADLLRGGMFACAIVDVDVEDMKGWDAVRILRAISPWLAVIMTASANTVEIERQVREGNVAYYYLKSFDPEELVQAVEGLCKAAVPVEGTAAQPWRKGVDR